MRFHIPQMHPISKQHNQIGIKCSDMWSYGGNFHSNHNNHSFSKLEFGGIIFLVYCLCLSYINRCLYFFFSRKSHTTESLGLLELDHFQDFVKY